MRWEVCECVGGGGAGRRGAMGPGRGGYNEKFDFHSFLYAIGSVDAPRPTRVS